MVTSTAPDAKQRLLSSQPLFEGLPRSVVSRLAPHLDQVEFREGEVLMRRGRYQHSLLIVVEGAVDVECATGLTDTFGPGRWFGGRAMLTRCPATATAVARTGGQALVMSHAQFRALKSSAELVGRLATG
jgi:CRP-like cAMP-binding protein